MFIWGFCERTNPVQIQEKLATVVICEILTCAALFTHFWSLTSLSLCILFLRVCRNLLLRRVGKKLRGTGCFIENIYTFKGSFVNVGKVYLHIYIYKCKRQQVANRLFCFFFTRSLLKVNAGVEFVWKWLFVTLLWMTSAFPYLPASL